jgi:hypothetical protein
VGRSRWTVGTLLVLAACGSDVEDSTEFRAMRDQRDTLSEQLADRDSSVGDLADQLSAAESRVAEAETNGVRLEQQLAANTAELEKAKQELSSVDDATDAFTEFAAEAAYQWLGVSPSESDCLAEGLVTDEDARDAFWDMLSYYQPVTEGDEPPAVLDELFGNCGLDVADFMSFVMEGDAYGDNPELDAMWDACAAGDGDACDELYFNSLVGTEYEAFAATCGDRFENDRHAGMCYEVDLAAP